MERCDDWILKEDIVGVFWKGNYGSKYSIKHYQRTSEELEKNEHGALLPS